MRLALLVALALAPAALAVPLTEPVHATLTTIVFGQNVRLSGRFTHRLADQPVVLSAKEYGDTAYASVAVLSTSQGGRWVTTIAPSIQTSYKASSLGETTAALAIRVRPRVALRRAHGHWVVRVFSTGSYAGRFVLIQLRDGGAWKNLGRVVLRRKPRRFDVRLPRGMSRVRAYLPRSQAGRGYLAGTSATAVVRR
jgi:hypothetical protein